MITFKRIDCNAVASVDVVIPYYNERSYPLSFHCSNEAYAGLLLKAMDNRLTATLKSIRQTAYEQGWKDAKGKKVRETWFRGNW